MPKQAEQNGQRLALQDLPFIGRHIERQESLKETSDLRHRHLSRHCSSSRSKNQRSAFRWTRVPTDMSSQSVRPVLSRFKLFTFISSITSDFHRLYTNIHAISVTAFSIKVIQHHDSPRSLDCRRNHANLCPSG